MDEEELSVVLLAQVVSAATTRPSLHNWKAAGVSEMAPTLGMRFNKELLCTALFGVKICKYSSLKRDAEEGTVPRREH